MRFIHYVLVLAALFMLIGCAGVSESDQRDYEKKQFLYSIKYEGTHGQVGYHMNARPRANCPGGWEYGSAEMSDGTLPPGIHMNGSTFEGTPQQPGDWGVFVKFYKLKCHDEIYTDKTVYVEFHIKGIAVKRVR